MFALGNLSTNNEKQTVNILNYFPIVLETMKTLLNSLPRLPDEVMKQASWILKNMCQVTIDEAIVSNFNQSDSLWYS